MTNVIFADWDDPDIAALAKGPQARWMKLGLPADRYSLSLDNTGAWHIESDDATLSSDLLARVDRVVFRRWRSSPPRPLVIADSGDPHTDSYIERQWDAALLGILEHSFTRRPQAWSRNPVRSDLKITTMLALAAIVRVPSFSVSRSIATPQGPLVFKSLHVDQSLGNGRVPTVAITEEEAHQVQPCPALYQQMISVTEEWRVGYVFGTVSIVARTFAAGGQVDRRFEVPTQQRSVCCPEVEREARLVADIMGLRMYTADILVSEVGTRYWCDINPDGLFLAADVPTGHLMGALISGLSL